jgi:1-acyl-sn-glycerol-3-phosphate acyltransferase
MRAKIHKFIKTEGLTAQDTRALNDKARTVIWDELCSTK